MSGLAVPASPSRPQRHVDLEDWTAARREIQKAKPNVDGILKKLSGLRYPIPNLKDEEVAQMLISLSTHVSVEAEKTWATFCTLVCSVCMKQSPMWKPSTMDTLVQYFCNVLEARPSGRWVLVDALRALGSVIYENGSMIQKWHSVLLGLLEPFVSPSETEASPDAQAMALQCYGNLITKCDKLSDDHIIRIGDSIWTCLKGAELPRVISSALRALHFLLQECKQLSPRCTVDAAAVLQSVRGLVVYKEEMSGPNRVNSSHSLKESDSESDGANSSGHGSGPSGNRNDKWWKVRVFSALCIQSIAKTRPNLIQANVGELLPDRSVTSFRDANLVSVMCYDPSDRVRQAAAAAITSVLESSKKYWTVASDSSAKSTSAFLSKSAEAAAIVREMHFVLASCITAYAQQSNPNRPPVSPGVATQCLRSVTILLQSSIPYNRLNKGLFTSVLDAITTLLRLSDKHLLLADTSGTGPVFSSLLSAVTALMEAPDAASELPPLRVYELVDPLLAFVEKKNEHTTLKCEAFVSLGHVLARSVDIVMGVDAAAVVARTLDAVNAACATHSAESRLCVSALKCCQVWLGAACKHIPSEDESSCATAVLTSVWSSVLDNCLVPVLASSSEQVRSAVYDTMAEISSDEFTKLDKPHRTMAVSMALGGPEDTSMIVLAASARLLGTLVLFDEMKDDDMFLNDVADALSALVSASDPQPHLNVRVKVAWTLANLCDAVSQRFASANLDDTVRQLMEELLAQLSRMSLVLVADHDRVRVNAVRGLGHIARIAPVTFLLSPGTGGASYGQEIVSRLSERSKKGSVKVQWNSCYALGQLYKNVELAAARTLRPFAQESLMVLCSLMQSHRNFKVRIQAAQALANVTSLQWVDGPGNVLDGIIEATRHAEEMEEFSEFRYKETLESALCNLVLHWMLLLRPERYQDVQAVCISRLGYVLSFLASTETKSRQAMERRAYSSGASSPSRGQKEADDSEASQQAERRLIDVKRVYLTVYEIVAGCPGSIDAALLVELKQKALGS